MTREQLIKVLLKKVEKDLNKHIPKYFIEFSEPKENKGYNSVSISCKDTDGKYSKIRFINQIYS